MAVALALIVTIGLPIFLIWATRGYKCHYCKNRATHRQYCGGYSTYHYKYVCENHMTTNMSCYGTFWVDEL
jgi:hypothetical protein